MFGIFNVAIKWLLDNKGLKLLSDKRDLWSHPLYLLLLKDVKSLQAVQRYACVPILEVCNGIVIRT